MSIKFKYINWAIALIWLVNGLICKVLNIVPRHEKIIAEILGDRYSSLLRVLIGLSEIGMFVWIITGLKPKLAMWMQIVIILTMNVLEFIMVPELLMWGRLNICFAFVLCGLIYWNNTKNKVTYA